MLNVTTCKGKLCLIQDGILGNLYFLACFWHCPWCSQLQTGMFLQELNQSPIHKRNKIKRIMPIQSFFQSSSDLLLPMELQYFLIQTKDLSSQFDFLWCFHLTTLLFLEDESPFHLLLWNKRYDYELRWVIFEVQNETSILY